MFCIGRRADLIVMGTHGRRGLTRLALGSSAEAVVRDTRIPVLLVHESDHAVDAPAAHAGLAASRQPAPA